MPTDRLEQVRYALDAHRIRFWVDHMAISIDGRPAMTYVYIGRGTDADKVQAIFDAVA